MIELVELFIEEPYIAPHKREQRLQRAKKTWNVFLAEQNAGSRNAVSLGSFST
jgi:hypothetical protein